MSAAMVRAIIAGRKTQTRRALRKQPHAQADRIIEPFGDGAQWFAARNPHDAEELLMLDEVPRCPYGVPGDRLWLREAWRVSRRHDAVPPRDLKARSMTIFYEAGGSLANQASGRWEPDCWPAVPDERPSWVGRRRAGMHMPRWASRITLEITGVRVERLQDISVAGALAEGIERLPRLQGYGLPDGSHFHCTDPRLSYLGLFETINGPGSVEANPFVWALDFRRLP